MAASTRLHLVSPLTIVALALPTISLAQRPDPPAWTYAQRLVDETVARYRSVTSVELALVRDGACLTVAATAPEDIGEQCDADELDPIRTGAPAVDEPTREDPVYDITQALHDSTGRVIGAVGMDIVPEAGMDRAAVLRLAHRVLAELERRIPSAERLGEPAEPSRQLPDRLPR
jgi:hypothetical protein